MPKEYNIKCCLVKVWAKLRFLAPSAGIAETEQTLSSPPTPCHDAQVMGSYWGSNPFHLTVLASKSGLHHCNTTPQHVLFHTYLQW